MAISLGFPPKGIVHYHWIVFKALAQKELHQHGHLHFEGILSYISVKLSSNMARISQKTIAKKPKCTYTDQDSTNDTENTFKSLSLC